MSDFYLAKGLAGLRSEINALFPKRDKTSDGWVGDTAHSARKSDHNPDYSRKGVVRALDIDKDGIPINKIVEFLVGKIKAGHTRCDGGCYVIFNRVIWTATRGGRAADYTGSNPHDKHAHFSICSHANHYDQVASWGLKAFLSPKATKGNPYNNPPVRLNGRKYLGQGGVISAQEIKFIQWVAGTRATGVKTDQLQALIKKGQGFVGLPQTGRCDGETIRRFAAFRR